MFLAIFVRICGLGQGWFVVNVMELWMPIAQARTFREFALESIASNEQLITFAAALVDLSPGEARIVFTNERLESLTGYHSSELRGRRLSMLFGARTDPKARTNVSDGLANGEEVQAELLCYHRSGGCFWSRIRLQPVIDEHGDAQLVFVAIQDVTRMRRLKQALLDDASFSDRTRRSLQIVVDKTEARYGLAQQFQSTLVDNVLQSWKRNQARKTLHIICPKREVGAPTDAISLAGEENVGSARQGLKPAAAGL